MKRGLIILIICHFSVDLFTGIWPLYKKLAHIDLTTAGFIAMGGGIIGNFSQLIFGIIADKGHRKALLLTGILLSSTASLYYLRQESWFYLLILLATMIGSSMFHPSATGAVGNLSNHKKGFLLSLFISGGGLGLALGQSIYFEIYTLFNGNTLLILILPIVCIVTCLYIPSKALESIQDKKIDRKQNHKMKLFQVFKKIWILYFIEVFSASINVGIIFLIPELMEKLEMGNRMINGAGHFSYIFGAVAMTIIVGSFADKIGHKKTLILSYILVIPLWYFFLNCHIDSFSIKLLLFLFVGGLLGICNPIGVAMGHHLLPKSSSLVSALLMGCAWAVGNISNGGTGYLAKHFGVLTTLNILGILLFINLIFMLNLKSDTLHHQKIIKE